MKHEPIFKSIFGNDWGLLPPVLKKHYANRGYTDDVITVEGKMEVMCKWYLRPLFKLIKTAPPYCDMDIPAIVYFNSEPNSNTFCFNREFHYPNRIKPSFFRSRLTAIKGNLVREQMSFGICWNSTYSWNGKRIIIAHNSYSLQLLGITLPLPVTWLLGRSDAYEIPVDDNHFDMCASITHPLLGLIYQYKGSFTISAIEQK